MTTPLDIITDAFLSLGAVEGGEAPEPSMANDALRMLNNLLDQLSNERMMLFALHEVIHELTPAKQTYLIGPGGDVGAAFTGTISGTTLTVSTLTSGALSVGQLIAGSFAASGTVTGLTVTAQGVGYLSLPALGISGGGGTGAAATATLTAVAAVEFAAGVGYAIGDIVTVVGGTFTRAATVRVIIPGTMYDVVDGGVYSVLPGTGTTFGGTNFTGGAGSITTTGGSGTGLTLLVCWGLGTPTLTNAGSGYTSAPAVAVTGGAPNSAGTVTAAITAVSLGSVTTGTTITSYGSGTGGNGLSALGTYFVNLTQTGGTTSMTATSPRPLRINSGFVRIPNTNGFLDFPIETLNAEQYERIGLKTLNGPWPRAVYYQPTEPLGILNYWPNPSQGEMHLFCDMLLNQFATLSDNVLLPQGYKMAFMWMLAEILMPQYPVGAAAAETRAMIPEFARQGRALIKRTNMQPIQQVQFDSILNSSRTNDAGWILHGGFNS